MRQGRRPRRSLAALIALGLLAGCAGQKENTLGSLRYQAEPEVEPKADAEVIDASLAGVRMEYVELLQMIDDARLQEQVERRVADVYMLEGEQEQGQEAQSHAGQSYYLEAIKSYRNILEKYPNSPDNAEVLYQLAKAYDMEGDLDEALVMLQALTSRHPDYRNIAEANFRKADILFNNGDYAKAEEAYSAVLDHEASSFYDNAQYMLGWSRYKQFEYRDALDDFVVVLNRLMPAGADLDDLSSPDQSLVEDTLHVVSLSLDKLAGASVIQDIPELKDQHYVWMLYDELGQYYLEKELYEASADSYRQFISNHPADDIAPEFHRKLIDTYMEGSFPGQALEEKEAFVEAYGTYSEFAQQRGGVPEPILEPMEEYLDELARNYHARGQALQDEIEELSDDDRGRGSADKLEDLDRDALAALEKAAHFYQQFADTFPDYNKLDELIFYRAEALFAARRYEDAIPPYEQVAYEPQSEVADEYSADAAYAAIVAYEKNLEKESAQQKQGQSDAADSMLRFVGSYHQDERSASVLSKAADYLFSVDKYEEALQVARNLMESQSDLDRDLERTAYGITAHSLFRLERFEEAGEDYLAQRQLVDENSEEYQGITERLASAIYKHAEGLMDTEENETAIDELLSLKQLAPNSPVRITAQYDAATLLLDMKNWPDAIAELQELDEGYPDHELAVESPRKLALAHERNEDWEHAAEAYMRLNESDPDEDLSREALYLAALMYENAEDYRSAIYQFRDYAHGYPEPFSTNMEARYKLTQNYARVNDGERRRFWLQKLVEGHRDASDEGTQRSRWLAAWANNEYGDYHAQEFKRFNLYTPLDESLPPKNEHLEKATDRYEMAADSGIFDFVTMSAYKIGDLYERFAAELRELPRPKGLSQEEKQLYAEILNEEARPFEELAMEIHQSNVERAWDGEFDPWIEQSFASMRELNPGRYEKTETIVSYGDEIR